MRVLRSTIVGSRATCVGIGSNSGPGPTEPPPGRRCTSTLVGQPVCRKPAIESQPRTCPHRSMSAVYRAYPCTCTAYPPPTSDGIPRSLKARVARLRALVRSRCRNPPQQLGLYPVLWFHRTVLRARYLCRRGLAIIFTNDGRHAYSIPNSVQYGDVQPSTAGLIGSS